MNANLFWYTFGIISCFLCLQTFIQNFHELFHDFVCIVDEITILILKNNNNNNNYALNYSVKIVDVKSWIICDGDIDPEWIESLNSVLDDNRLLTMPSGERIRFGNNVNFLFETHDLTCASPATISRMGIIFLRYKSFQYFNTDSK